MESTHNPRNISFSSLPLQKDGPRGNAWGRFGENDQLGTLNLLTAETTLAAAKEIQKGIRIPLDLPLDKFEFPLHARDVFKQEIRSKAPRPSNDDVLTFNTQTSTQWDGLRHYGGFLMPRDIRMSGFTTMVVFKATLNETVENGIHVIVENGGMVGRGVLLDYHSWATAKGIAHPAFESFAIPLTDLLKVAEHQETTFRPGDILLLRTGYTEAYDACSREEKKIIGETPSAPKIGVEQSAEMLKWLWDTQFAAVASDHPSFEVWPAQDKRFYLHEWLIAGWGMPIGEMFNLGRLASECEKTGRYTFFFNSMPLYVTGGVASPPNAVAIL